MCVCVCVCMYVCVCVLRSSKLLLLSFSCLMQLLLLVYLCKVCYPSMVFLIAIGILLIRKYFSLFCSTGDAQSLSCDSNIAQPLCPGTITKCTCASGGTLTRWNFTTLNPCPNNFNFIALTQQAPCSSSLLSASGTCGAYLSAASNSPSQAGSACPSSTLTITANPSLNGLTIECRDVSSALPGTLIGTRNINIAG